MEERVWIQNLRFQAQIEILLYLAGLVGLNWSAYQRYWNRKEPSIDTGCEVCPLFIIQGLSVFWECLGTVSTCRHADGKAPYSFFGKSYWKPWEKSYHFRKIQIVLFKITFPYTTFSFWLRQGLNPGLCTCLASLLTQLLTIFNPNFFSLALSVT